MPGCSSDVAKCCADFAAIRSDEQKLDQKSRGDRWFEVIAGKSMPAEGAAKCFAYVQIYDTKPKRRLFELMKSQGLQANQQLTF